ncbi:hypothetical protein EYF80_048089 [Liparis tanakae]|uniref:Uncharacterized protein n=1 Tax=Liparis tanakae TaxID=230148 RepID=A0A4Z2FLU0_9TELE|nr:hypothetical protein EYF80_048089 [Liparis tanakae]
MEEKQTRNAGRKGKKKSQIERGKSIMGPRASLSMTPGPVDETSACCTSSSSATGAFSGGDNDEKHETRLYHRPAKPPAAPLGHIADIPAAGPELHGVIEPRHAAAPTAALHDHVHSVSTHRPLRPEARGGGERWRREVEQLRDSCVSSTPVRASAYSAVVFRHKHVDSGHQLADRGDRGGREGGGGEKERERTSVVEEGFIGKERRRSDQEKRKGEKGKGRDRDG